MSEMWYGEIMIGTPPASAFGPYAAILRLGALADTSGHRLFSREQIEALLPPLPSPPSSLEEM